MSCDTAPCQRQRINDLVWGFIDGTVRGVCRPSHPNQVVQNNFYNGHHRYVLPRAPWFYWTSTSDGLDLLADTMWSSTKPSFRLMD